ncbi:hypothetical protein EG68_00021 [Paragonimus skrjabini miyazakii]|uniref:DNA repair protein XRCC4 n=1 Tax=Paragonimus skrjabini miyazakii TaxID=59628 RepID=A0A8S9Z9V6_9TREM|nr:hypothetical protein EG68_00021 [Paragonimus skrjabini miyazakii]
MLATSFPSFLLRICNVAVYLVSGLRGRFITPSLEAEIKQSLVYTQVADHLTIGCWRDELLTLIIHHDGVFWRGSYNANELQTWTNQSGSTVNVYAAKLLKALSDHRETDPLFTIEVKHSSLELLWSKEVKSGIGITFGSFCLSLTTDVNQTLTDLVELLFSEITQARSECTRLDSENSALQECTNTAVQKYEKLLGEVEQREFLLLSRFVVVLNEKKRKIAQILGNAERHDETTRSAFTLADYQSGSKTVSECSLDDSDDLLLPKIPRTSRALLVRRPSRLTGLTKRKTCSTSSELKMTTKDTPETSFDDLLNSL